MSSSSSWFEVKDVSDESLPTLLERFFDGEPEAAFFTGDLVDDFLVGDLDLVTRLETLPRPRSFGAGFGISETCTFGGSDCSVDGITEASFSVDVGLDGERCGSV